MAREFDIRFAQGLDNEIIDPTWLRTEEIKVKTTREVKTDPVEEA